MKSAFERFTMYDIFGYFIPGIIALLTITAFFGYEQVLPGTLGIDSTSWAIATLVITYLLGHLCHSIANWTFPKKWATRRASARIPESIRLHAAKQIELHSGAPSSTESPFLNAFCEAFLNHVGGSHLHGIYLAHEGFYRALGVITAGTLIGSITQLIVLGHVSLWKHDIGKIESALVIVAEILLILLWTKRWQRFLGYRIEALVYSAACYPKEKGGSKYD